MVSNIFYVHPYLGKIPILTNIFQRRWNHQLVTHLRWTHVFWFINRTEKTTSNFNKPIPFAHEKTGGVFQQPTTPRLHMFDITGQCSKDSGWVGGSEYKQIQLCLQNTLFLIVRPYFLVCVFYPIHEKNGKIASKLQLFAALWEIAAFDLWVI